MRARRVSLAGCVVCLLIAGPALAAGKFDSKAAAMVAGIVPVAGGLIQFLLAILLPRFARRLQRAISQGFLPCAGWGALFAVLAAVVAAVVGQGGTPGKTLAAVVGIAAGALALAGGIGIAKIIGDWSLRRWQAEAVGPVSVLCGATVWAVAVAVPIVGWVAGLFGLFAGLGAAALVLLHPSAFDPPPAPAPVRVAGPADVPPPTAAPPSPSAPATTPPSAPAPPSTPATPSVPEPPAPSEPP